MNTVTFDFVFLQTDFETSTEEEFSQCETLDCLLDLINQDKETEELLQVSGGGRRPGGGVVVYKGC